MGALLQLTALPPQTSWFSPSRIVLVLGCLIHIFYTSNNKIYGMDEEVDIGLTNLARRSGSFASRTPRRTPHRPSTLSIGRGPVSSPLKSPSSPSLFKEFQKAGRRLSRSNTLPRIVSQPEADPNGLGNLSMEPEKVGRLRRWIHALAIGLFQLLYHAQTTINTVVYS